MNRTLFVQKRQNQLDAPLLLARRPRQPPPELRENVQIGSFQTADWVQQQVQQQVQEAQEKELDAGERVRLALREANQQVIRNRLGPQMNP